VSPELPDFYAPLDGFDQPLAIVRACQQRLRHMVEMLIPLREHVREHGADERAAVTAGTIRTFFEDAWLNHLQDQQLDIVPRLRARLHNRHTVWARNLVETIDAVSEQHRAFVPLWQSVAALLRQIESGASARLDDPSVRTFVQLVRIHLVLEEDVLGPACARLLTAEDVQQIGTAMAKRRRIPWPAPSGERLEPLL
jgi:pyridoxamine 5'-phosphate oxidase